MKSVKCKREFGILFCRGLPCSNPLAASFLYYYYIVCLFLFLFFNSLPNGVVFHCVLELSNGALTNKVMVGPFCLLEAADAYLEFLYYIYSPKDLVIFVLSDISRQW